MRIEVDTLDYVIGEVLSMKCKDRKWKLAAFPSKFLNEIRRSYKIYDKKMLTVIRGLETGGIC